MRPGVKSKRPIDKEFREDTLQTAAALSPCRKYRFALWRIWDETRPYALVIGLNPSTTDEKKDDPTIRRCVQFARSCVFRAQRGCTILLIANAA